jgi:hypothetical protein
MTGKIIAINNLLTDGDENDELEILGYYAYAIPRQFRDRENAFEKYGHFEFKARFRLEKEATLILLQKIQASLETSGHNCKALSPLDQLLLTLRFYATSSFQVLL